jgi:serine/threonine protein phosphatase PrpC
MIVQSYGRLVKARDTIAGNIGSDDKLSEDLTSEDSKEPENSWRKSLSDMEQYDAMMCEAIRSSCQYADRKLRSSTNSGTTLSSLFLRFNEQDGSTRVLCGNVGDSRTVMVCCDEIDAQVDNSTIRALDEQQISFSSNLSISGRSTRSNMDQMTSIRSISSSEENSTRLMITSTKLVTEFESTRAINSLEAGENSNHSAITATTKESQLTDITEGAIVDENESAAAAYNSGSGSGFGVDIGHVSTHGAGQNELNSSTHSSIAIRRTSRLVPMSEDHTLSLARERARILAKDDVQYHALPMGSSDALKIPIAEEMIKSLVKHIASQSPEDAKFFAKINYVDEPMDDTAAVVEAEDNRSRAASFASANSKKAAWTIQLVRQDSFVAHRRGANGEVGPEAVFGRYNVSVMMTRSLGDRYGPRCCRGIPDIRAVTVPYNRHARFILASDGVWDVISSEYIRCNALRSKFLFPQSFANFVANKARRLRERQGLRMDDITVIVVDVNGLVGGGSGGLKGSSFKTIESKAGTDVLVDGASTSQCMDGCFAPGSCITQ